MKKIKAKTRIKIKGSLFLIVIFSLSFLSMNLNLFPIEEKFLDNDILSNDDIDKLMISAIYSDIAIDDSPGSPINWTWARTQPWCTQGSGTSGDPYIIENHTFNSAAFSGICLRISHSRKNFIIRNCIIKDSNPDQSGILLKNTTEGVISNNNIYNTGLGIYLLESSKITVDGNTVYENKIVGIFAYLSNYDNIISGNIVHNNSQWGILMQECNFNNLSGNIVYNHTLSDIYLLSSHNNDLAGNTVYDSKENGILLDNSDDGKNYGNWIYDNKEFGIYCTSGSDDNQFYENVFVRNKKHAVDEGSDNVWNSTAIGNYWDNHTGPDTSPHDGIVDIQYNITGLVTSIDYLPIAEDGAPIITIVSPNAGDVFNETTPDFTITVTEDFLYSMWYTIDGGSTEYPFTSFSGTIDQSAWDALSDGNFTFTFYATDLPGNTGTDEVFIEKDSQAPVITINSPADEEVFGKTPPSFNITIVEPNLDTIWYTVDSNFTIIDSTLIWTINQTIWSGFPEGSVTITVFANDTVGHTSSEEVAITKNIPSVIGLDYFLTSFLITLIGGVAIITIIAKIHFKKRIISH